MNLGEVQGSWNLDKIWNLGSRNNVETLQINTSNAGASSSQQSQPTAAEVRFNLLMLNMSDRTFISTQEIDFYLLDEMGVLQDFRYFTSRVCIQKKF